MKAERFEGATARKSAVRLIIKKCHVCGHISESKEELRQCKSCQKAFLPLNYFGKIHAKNETEFRDLFASSGEIEEEDLIKGLIVLW